MSIFYWLRRCWHRFRRPRYDYMDTKWIAEHNERSYDDNPKAKDKFE